MTVTILIQNLIFIENKYEEGQNPSFSVFFCYYTTVGTILLTILYQMWYNILRGEEYGIYYIKTSF